MRLATLLALLGTCLQTARADVGYAWLKSPVQETLEHRIAPPKNAQRVPVAAGSFGEWLRRLPLLPNGSPVLLFDGTRKARQDVHAAVIDLDVGKRDLQQCADAVMRLRAEYLFAAGRPRDIVFHPDPGKPRAISWTGDPKNRAGWDKFLVRLFADAGSASLQAEMIPVGARAVEPGDVLIQGGYPGHAVIVLDAALASDGKLYLLIGQSYMPAQQFHVVKNFGDASLSPWFDAAALDGGGLQTPEWRPFFRRDARHFSP
jgi:hypothetical protein